MDTTCPELVTDSQMARILRVNLRWLRAEAEAGRIPSVKAERRYLFNRLAVEKTLAARAEGNRLAAVETAEIFRLLRTVEAEFGGNCRTATVLRQELALRDKKALDVEGTPQ